MKRLDVSGFDYIVPFENLASVLRVGILPHEDAEFVRHTSVADPDVQRRRDAKLLPNGYGIHQCANVYFNARNAMMYRLRHEDICVVRVSAAVLDIEDALISDRNAAVWNATFLECPEGLDEILEDVVFGRYWNDEDQKQRMMAEVLVPDRIGPEHIQKVLVKSAGDIARVRSIDRDVEVICNANLFFNV